MKSILLIFFPLIMFIQSYETQKYTLIDKSDDFEIRYYPKSLKAKVISETNSNNNFMKLKMEVILQVGFLLLLIIMQGKLFCHG